MATKERSFKVEFQDLPKMEDITKDQEKNYIQRKITQDRKCEIDRRMK